MRQIMIELSENDYELACKYPDALIAVYAHAIKNGTPLPKGHGRLIDEREVYKKFYCRCLAGAAKEVLDETSTIIEADKAESEVEV